MGGLPTTEVKRFVNATRDMPTVSLSCEAVHWVCGLSWMVRSTAVIAGSEIAGLASSSPRPPSTEQDVNEHQIEYRRSGHCGTRLRPRRVVVQQADDRPYRREPLMVGRHHEQVRHHREVGVHLAVVQPVGPAEELEVGGAE